MATTLLMAFLWLATPIADAADGYAAGNSLFDQLFGRTTPDGYVHQVPFPFERLLASLDTRLPPRDPQRTRSYSTTLIPHGRSLQRDVAGPDYFRFPRIVLAIDTQPHGRRLMRDRLFLGYQEKAEQIEVISYNAAAGRFEFQVVSDYAAGKRPVVRPAQRTLCVSCHQNEGAIFARAGWSETTTEPAVAKRIGSWHPHGYHGVAVEDVASDAGRIDSASDRANLLAAYQRVWRDGCEMDAGIDASRRCRAGVFSAMLRYRLGAWSGLMIDRHAVGSYRAQLLANWRNRWPRGLPIPDPDLPDREAPLAYPALVDVPAVLDPLRRRPPRTHWHAASHVDRAVKGLADAFVLVADIERLDRALHQRSTLRLARQRTYQGDCDLRQKTDRSGNHWLNIACNVADSNGGTGYELVTELVADSSLRLNPGLSWLYFDHRSGTAQAGVTGAVVSQQQGELPASLHLVKRYEHIRARTLDGTAMSSIRFEWTDTATGVASTGTRRGRVTLTLTPDLDLVSDAIDTLSRRAIAGQFAGFDGQPLRGSALMNALFEVLGVPYPPDRQALPAPAAATADSRSPVSAADSRDGDAGWKLLQRHCGACHRSPGVRLPPGFMAGNPQQVTSNLRHCAPRIAYRLAMWDMAPEARTKSPMPPASHLHVASIDADEWRSSEDYRQLLAFAGSLTDSPAADVPYAGLPPCLPPANRPGKTD